MSDAREPLYRREVPYGSRLITYTVVVGCLLLMLAALLEMFGVDTNIDFGFDRRRVATFVLIMTAFVLAVFVALARKQVDLHLAPGSGTLHRSSKGLFLHVEDRFDLGEVERLVAVPKIRITGKAWHVEMYLNDGESRFLLWLSDGEFRCANPLPRIAEACGKPFDVLERHAATPPDCEQEDGEA